MNAGIGSVPEPESRLRLGRTAPLPGKPKLRCATAGVLSCTHGAPKRRSACRAVNSGRLCKRSPTGQIALLGPDPSEEPRKCCDAVCHRRIRAASGTAHSREILVGPCFFEDSPAAAAANPKAGIGDASPYMPLAIPVAPRR